MTEEKEISEEELEELIKEFNKYFEEIDLKFKEHRRQSLMRDYLE